MSRATSSTISRGAFVGEVIANDSVCREHYRLHLGFAEFPKARPGQFVQLQCRPLGEQLSQRQVDWSEHEPPRFTQSELTDREPLLRRPFSLASHREIDGGSVVLEIIYRAIGTGSTWLAGVRVGESLSVLGPLGNAFEIAESKPLAALIGGGVGIPPMLFQVQALAAARKKTFAFNGVRTRDLLPLTVIEEAEVSAKGRPTPCIAEFAAFDADSVIATDDGSLGFTGTVDEAFREWLDANPDKTEHLAVYCCGPEELMRSVSETCLSRRIECQLAMERYMGCGMGACQSCVVKIRDESEGGWSYKLCCTDGPIFNADRIVWD